MMELELARRITVDPSIMLHQEFEKRCAVCGDKSTGNHFGSPGACEGCKGFFRRHVRTQKTFHCKWEKNCEVVMTNRKKCKYCRFQKCLQVGMDPKAVHISLGKHIDKIDTQSKELLSAKTLDLTNLLQADYMARGRGYEYLKAYVGHTLGQNRVITPFTDSDKRIGEYVVNSDLIMMVEWIRNIPGFKFLPLEDQVLLLRAHAAEYYILSMAFRSVGQSDCIISANGDLHPVSLHQLPPDGKKTQRNRILEELSSPFEQINIDEVVFNCFKALVMLDPTVEGLSSRKKVAEMRKQAKTLLQQYLQSRQDGWTSDFRMARLLCILSSLQDISSNWLERHREMHVVPSDNMPRLMVDMFWIDPIKTGKPV